MADGWEVWSSYRPSDFLMFAPRTYWRLVELYNADLAPLQGLWLAIGGVLAWAVAARRPWAARASCLGMAAACAAVAWGWHWQRYAAINWAAPWLAGAFALQALVWAGTAVFGNPVLDSAPPRRLSGVALWLAALGVWPLLGRAAGRPWAQAEFFGLMPDPTLLACLGALLLLRPAGRAWRLALWPLPLLGCALAGVGLATMGDALAPLLPLAALGALGALHRARHSV